MGKDSLIPWTDHTFNPWIGCTKVSPGCAHCYAEREQDLRYGRVKWGAGQPRHRTTAANWRQPLKWNKAEETVMVDHVGFAAARRPRVFCASLADWLDAEVPNEWLADLLDLIRRTPNLDWLLLTKRPQNWWERLRNTSPGPSPEYLGWLLEWLNGHAPANVWLGTTVENQERADERITHLLSIPARVRFLSCEPMLGALDLEEAYPGKEQPGRIDWVIVGGESGADARPFPLEHAWDLVMQCKAASVPVFVKQLGAQPITTNANLYEWPDETTLEQHGTEAAGARVILRDRNGRDLSEWPEEFQVQEFPNTQMCNSDPSK